MARLPRICLSGIPQHVIQRGNNRQVCFASDEDFAAYAQWYLNRKACPQPKQAKKSLDCFNPFAALKESVSGYTSKQAKKMFLPDPKEPIFRYVYEVTDVKVKPAHDSLFQIPSGYKIATRE